MNVTPEVTMAPVQNPDLGSTFLHVARKSGEVAIPRKVARASSVGTSPRCHARLPDVWTPDEIGEVVSFLAAMGSPLNITTDTATQ